MKPPTRSNAICLLAMLAIVLFATATLVPNSASANVVYTNGNGMTEGDPIDGLGSPNAGGSGDPFISNSDSRLSDESVDIFYFVWVFYPMNFNAFSLTVPTHDHYLIKFNINTRDMNADNKFKGGSR